MRLYDTFSQNKIHLPPPIEPICIYVCGITPYDTTHLGHAFTYTSADILVRFLEHKRWPVRYAQNVTDIDDDILRRAAEVGEDWRSLGNRWTAHYIRDMQALNVRAPDYYPRASGSVPQIIDMVKTLVGLGVAYVAAGNVYYHVRAWPEFGRLSHLPAEAMLPLANERGNRPDDANKRDPLDFVLWQAQAPGEPAWESPWGGGRPGWHIECSTLITRFLGPRIDIHGGGSDLIFPHHECEIAQTEPATGHKPFVRCWMHTAMVAHNGEKMSKSLGNLVMIDDLLKSWPADSLRLYLAGHHYRHEWHYDEAGLAQAALLGKRLNEATNVASGSGPSLSTAVEQSRFEASLDDDLDTPGALVALEQCADGILAAAKVGAELTAAQASLRSMCAVLGLRLDTGGPEPRVTLGWNRHLADFM